jgi:hypothetical protein
MARIRTIKPEFPQSESMGRVSRDARLCFIQLWTLADDEGRLRGNSRMLASLLFPYDDDAPSLIDGWLAELEEQASIRRYQIDGTNYVQVIEWTKHQKIDKPSPSKIPPIPADFESTAKTSFDGSSIILSKARESSLGDQGSRIKDQGMDQDQGSRKPPAAPWLTVDDLISDGLTPETAQGFLDHRRAKKAKLTALAWKGFLAEVEKATGWTLEAACLKAIARNWTGFESTWVLDSPRAAGGHINRQQALEDSNKAVGDRWLAKQQAQRAAGETHETQ